MKRMSYILFAVLILASAVGGSGCGSSYTVYGRVVDQLDQGLANVTISFSGGYSGTTITDADGNWSKAGLKGIVLVTPSKEGWTFDPTSRTVTGASSSVNFVGYPSTYAVSGRVTDQSATGVASVTISFSGGYGSTTTDSGGYWSKSGLSDTVTVTPSKSSWTFDPTSRSVTGASSSVNFVGNAIMKSWSFDFSNMAQEEMDSWFYGYDQPGYPGYYYSNDEGLVLHNTLFKCPINFTGDIVSRTYFYLNVTEYPVYNIFTALCDFDDNSWVDLYLQQLDYGILGRWVLEEVDEYHYIWRDYGEYDDIGLIWDGLNVIEMEKKNATISVRVNGEEIGSFNATYYDWEQATNIYMCVYLWIGLEEVAHGDVIFEKLEVDYSGEMTEI